MAETNNKSYIDMLYIEENPPANVDGSAVLIHGTISINHEQYANGSFDGDTILVTQSSTDETKLTWNTADQRLKVRLVGINAPEIQHYESGAKVYKVSDGTWKPVAQLTGQDLTNYNREKDTYAKGDRARDYILSLLGINVEQLRQTGAGEQTSKEFTLLIDRTQINTEYVDDSGKKTIAEPGMDTYGRYLGCVYCSHPTTGKMINLNKSELMQDFGTVPMVFYDKNNQANVSEYFNIEDYPKISYLNNGKSEEYSIPYEGAVDGDAVDDRVEIAKLLGFSADMNVDSFTIIGDSVFYIPPTNITVNKTVKSKKASVARSRNSIDKGSGHSDLEISMSLFFSGERMINGYPLRSKLPNGEDIIYYMNGFRQLFAQFRKTPFLPITNKLLNLTYNIEAVSLVNMTVSTVPDFPSVLKVDLIMTDFEPRTFITGLDASETFDKMIHWPLFRYYYQKSFMPENESIGHAYLKAVPGKLDGKLTFSMIKDSQLNQLAQEANIVARSKMSASQTNKKKTVDDYMVELGVPISVKDNYTTYKSFMDIYADYLKFYIEGSDTDPEDVLKKYIEKKNLGDSIFVRQSDGVSKFWFNLPVCLPFIYLKRDEDYILSEKWYREGSFKNAADFPIKLTNHNDFLFSTNYKIGVAGSAGSSSHAFDDIGVTDVGSGNGSYKGFWYQISKIGDTLYDAIVAKTTDESLTLIPPDVLHFCISPNELDVAGFISGDTLLEAHRRVCANLKNDSSRSKASSLISKIINKGKEYDEKLPGAQSAVDADKANEQANLEKLQSQNYVDDLDLEFEPMDIGYDPTAIAVGIKNTFADLQLLSLPTPTKQFMGGTDAVIKIGYTVKTKEAAKKINTLFEYSTYLIRRYRAYISDGFLKVDNEILNMMGINYVAITDMDMKTIEGYPDWYDITLTLTSFDRTQRNKEELKKIAQGVEEDLGKNTGGKINAEMMSSYITLINTLKDSEVYPDLELPTIMELSEKGFVIATNGGKFPDPDFYVSYKDRLLFSQALQQQVIDPTDLGKAFAFDANTGHSVSFDASKPLNDLEYGDSLKNDSDAIEKELAPKEKELKSKANSISSETTDFTASKALSSDVAKTLVDGSKATDSYYKSSVSFLGITCGLAGADDGKSDNLKKIKELIVKPSGDIGDVPEWYGKDISQDQVHKFIDEFADQYGIDKDTITRAIIHNLFQSVSECTHWKDFAGAKVKTSTDGDPNTSTGVGVASLNFRDGGYSAELKDKFTRNPLANLQEGMTILSTYYKDKTFSMPKGYGIYSKMEYSGAAKDFYDDGSSNTEANNPYADLKKEDIDWLTDETTKDLLASTARVSTRAFWESQDGATQPVLKAFAGVSANKQLIDKAIEAMEARHFWNFGAPQAAKDLSAALVNLANQGQKLIQSKLTDEEKEKRAKGFKRQELEDGLTEKDNGAIVDIKFERARWLAAAFCYKGFADELDAEHFLAMYQYVAGGFKLAAVTAGVSNAFKSQLHDSFRRMKDPSDKWSMKIITENGELPGTVADVFSSSNAEEGVEAFGDFRGDPSFVIQQDDIFKNSLFDMKKFDKKGRLSRAFPTFFLCLIDEGNTLYNWKLHDNFYGYNAINSIDVIRTRKMAASTCVVKMTNLFNAFWNWDTDSMYRRKSTFFDVAQSIFDTEDYVKTTGSKLRNADVNKAMIKPGARLHIRLGYSSNVNDMPILFNGTITEVEQGEIIEVIAQGDGIELCNKIPATPKDLAGNDGTVDEKNFVERVLGSLTGGTTEPRNMILDMFHTKGGFWKELIYNLTDGKLFNKNALGIVHFGNPEFKLIFNEGGEVAQNVYAGIDPIIVDGGDGDKKTIVAFDDSANIFATDDEPNFTMYLYNKTPWDVIQVCRMLVPDFIASVEPFEFRSTLFYGKSYYPFCYEYDYTNLDTKQIEEMLSKIGSAAQEAQKQAEAQAKASTSSQNTSNTSVQVNSGSNAAIAWNFFKSKGFSDAGTAGVMGNLQQESTINPNAVQGSFEGAGYGIGQWDNRSNGSGRWNKLVSWANSNGLDPKSMNAQLEYMLQELSGLEPTTASILKGYGGLNALKNATDAHIAADIFEKSFERAGTPMMENRYKYADGFLASYAGTVPTVDSNDNTSSTITKTEKKLISYLDELAKSPIKERRKSFQQTHMFSSFLDIVDNGIKASERGVYTATLGNFVGQGFLQSKGTFQTPVIYADTDIWEEKQKTAMVDCQIYAKGVPLLGFLPFVNSVKIHFNDQAKAINIATAALQDYLKEMYQGEMVVLGYPAIKPYDMMFIDDQYNQMNGLCEVQQVVHSFSVDTGYVTSITPDACVTQHDQFIKNKWITANSAIATLGAYFAARVTSALLAVKVLGLTRFAKEFPTTYGLSGLAAIKDVLAETKVMKGVAEFTAKMKEPVKEAANGLVKKLPKAVLEESEKATNACEAWAKLLEEVKKEPTAAKKILPKLGEHVDDFVKATRMGTFAFAAVELTATYIAERALVTWVKRYLRNRQAVSMTLLRQHGRELSAGINGHRGLVVGDSPSINDKIVSGLFGSDLATYILGDDVREVVNSTYNTRTGSVGVSDPTYKDKYKDQYVADCQSALGEMSSLLASSDKFASYQSSLITSGGNANGDLSYANALAYAKSLLGKPYVFGATGPNSYDCSGFTQEVYRHFGVTIGRTTWDQIKNGREVELKDIKPCDLILKGPSRSNPTHVVMYIGDNQIIHAPKPGDVIKIAPLVTSDVVSIRRIVEDLDKAGAAASAQNTGGAPAQHINKGTE